MRVLKEVRLRLTLLCTGITALIFLLISIAYLAVAETNLRDNQYSSFQNDIDTIVDNLDQQNIITHDWLAKLEAGGRYIIFLKDNGSDLYYETLKQHQNRKKLYESVKTYYESTDPADLSTRYSAYHTEFTYTEQTSLTKRERYFVSYCYFPTTQGKLEAYILKPLEAVYGQIYKQRLLFCAINIAGVLLLFTFYYYFVKRMLRPVAESQEKQNSFIAAASHEFRTPLAVILSSVSAMKDNGSWSRETKPDFCGIIEDETVRLSHLINDMLFLTNGKNPSARLQKENCELETLLLKCFESFEQLALDKEIRMDIRLPDTPMPYCTCDGEKMIQLLAILIHNAISYTDTGGMIVLKAWYKSNHHYVLVSDTGIGIKDEHKKKVFEQFYRVDRARSKKDHFGLGLSIAREIVNAHQGNIRIEDTPGGGSTFVVKL